MTVKEKMWAIKFVRPWGEGFYTGTYLTRKDAIADHVKQIGEPWKRMYRHGDRAVRVIITEAQLGAP